MRIVLLLLRLSLVASLFGAVHPAFAGGRGAYAADKNQDDVDDDDDDEAAAAKKKRREEQQRRDEERRRRRRDDDEDLRDDDDRKPRRRRDDDVREDDDRKPRRRRDDDVREDDDRKPRRRDDDDRDEDRRPRRRRDDDARDDDRRDDDDRRPRRRRDDDARDDDRRDDDYAPRRRHRRGDRGPAFRWGVSGGPAIGIGGSATGGATAITGGLNLPIVRVGYQFPQMDLVALGLFVEPRVGLFFTEPVNDIETTIALAGTFALQLNLGRYFFFAAGLSVGGNIVALQGDIARGPVMGGFLLRVGADLLLERRMGRPSALSIAFEALPMFAHYSVGPVDGTTTFATIGFSIGYDSY